jgi:putative transposase
MGCGQLFPKRTGATPGHQRSVPVGGPSVPGPLWRGGDGRAAFVGGRALHRSQSGGRGVGEPCRGLAWSSARAQLAGEDDELATVAPLRALIPDFAALLAMPTDATTTRIERAPTIGRPLGRPEWIATLEHRLGRPLAPRKPGPKPRVERDTARQAQLL